MKKQIVRITPVQTAKVFGLLYFILSIPFVGLMAISFAFIPGEKPGMAFLWVMPFAYMIFGFIFTLIGTAIYNVAAKLVGGIEYTSTTIDAA